MQAKMTYLYDEVHPDLLQPALYPNNSCIFDFECNYNDKIAKDAVRKHYYACFVGSAIYLVVIFSLKVIMQTREAFNLKWLLFTWNLVLSIFSVLGAVRFLPEMIHVLTNFGFYYSACSPTFTSSQVSGYWGCLFTFSKFVELFDTVFIVLRKKKLIFLHWYHHITVLMYTWVGSPYSIGPARYFVGMNYLVHAMMYPYYTLSACGLKLPKAVAVFVTTSQILQMFIGIYVTIYAVATRVRGIPCHFPDNHVKYGLIMYISYLILFINYFYQTYFASKKIEKKQN